MKRVMSIYKYGMVKRGAGAVSICSSRRDRSPKKEEMLMSTGQQRNAQWNTRKRRCQQPARTAEVDHPPVLYNDDAGYCDREKNGDRSSNLDRNSERKQRDGNQGFAKTKSRADHRGDEHHRQ